MSAPSHAPEALGGAEPQLHDRTAAAGATAPGEPVVVAGMVLAGALGGGNTLVSPVGQGTALRDPLG